MYSANSLYSSIGRMFIVWYRDLTRSDALITLVLPTPPLLARTLDCITGYHCSTNWRPVMLDIGMLTRPMYVLFSYIANTVITFFWSFFYNKYTEIQIYLASLFVRFLVEVQSKATNGRQIVEFKMFSPEDGVGARFAGGACIQHVIQAQLTIVALLSWKISGLNDPQLEHIFHPSAVVLTKIQGVLLLHYNSPYLNLAELTELQIVCSFRSRVLKWLHWKIPC